MASMPKIVSEQLLDGMELIIHVSEIQRKTNAKRVYNGIMGRNLGAAPLILGTASLNSASIIFLMNTNLFTPLLRSTLPVFTKSFSHFYPLMTALRKDFFESSVLHSGSKSAISFCYTMFLKFRLRGITITSVMTPVLTVANLPTSLILSS